MTKYHYKSNSLFFREFFDYGRKKKKRNKNKKKKTKKKTIQNKNKQKNTNERTNKNSSIMDEKKKRNKNKKKTPIQTKTTANKQANKDTNERTNKKSDNVILISIVILKVLLLKSVSLIRLNEYLKVLNPVNIDSDVDHLTVWIFFCIYIYNVSITLLIDDSIFLISILDLFLSCLSCLISKHYNNCHHHDQVVLIAWSFLTLALAIQ